MTLNVGQKVVYTARGKFPPWEKLGLSVPIKDEVYTIREFTDYAIPGLRLVEIVNPAVETGEGLLEPSWWVEEFSPVQ